MPKTSFAQLSQGRSNNFDFLRFFLAFIVIYTHAYTMAGVHASSWRGRLKMFDFGGAWLAVDGFFIISGFLITQSFLNSRGAGDYFKKRVLRIYPGFVMALIFCVFVVGPLAGVPLESYFRDWNTYRFFQPLLFRDVVTLPGVFQHSGMAGMVNGSIWTIRYELICYVMVAVVGVAGLLRKRGLMLALFLIAMAIAAAEAASVPNHAVWTKLIHFPYFGNLYEMPRFIVCFLGGMMFYLFRDRIPHTNGLLLLSLLLLPLAWSWATNLIIPVFGSYILFHVAFNRRIPLQNWGRSGDYSYGLYLYAFPVEQLVVQYSHNRIGAVPLLAISFAITMALAYLSWHFLEHPFLKLKGGTRRTAAACPVPSQV